MTNSVDVNVDHFAKRNHIKVIFTTESVFFLALEFRVTRGLVRRSPACLIQEYYETT